MEGGFTYLNIFVSVICIRQLCKILGTEVEDQGVEFSKVINKHVMFVSISFIMSRLSFPRYVWHYYQDDDRLRAFRFLCSCYSR